MENLDVPPHKRRKNVLISKHTLNTREIGLTTREIGLTTGASLMPRESNRRWQERGWTFQQATDYFRRLWQHALRNGLHPGDRVVFGEGDLRWLVQGHPDYADMSRKGVSHFTFRPDGRGNHRFALVDLDGREHPFSTRTALTGFVHPLTEPVRADDPFGGLTT